MSGLNDHQRRLLRKSAMRGWWAWQMRSRYGATYKAIGAACGISRSRVDQLIRRHENMIQARARRETASHAAESVVLYREKINREWAEENERQRERWRAR